MSACVCKGRAAEAAAGGALSPLVLAPVVLGALAAVWFLGVAKSDGEPGAETTRRSLADESKGGGAELDCGPAGMEHLSDLPALGLHVLTAEGGSFCAEGAASSSLTVHVDGSPADGEAPTLDVACEFPGAVDSWLLTALKRLVATQVPRPHHTHNHRHQPLSPPLPIPLCECWVCVRCARTHVSHMSAMVFAS